MARLKIPYEISGWQVETLLITWVTTRQRPIVCAGQQLVGQVPLGWYRGGRCMGQPLRTNWTAQEQLEQEEWEFPTKPWEIYIDLSTLRICFNQQNIAKPRSRRGWRRWCFSASHANQESRACWKLITIGSATT